MRDTMGYGKHKTAVKEDLPQRTEDDRFQWADTCPLKDMQWWHLVRFSDEFHCGFGPDDQLWIIRRRGKAMHLQALPKVHGWAVIGYNFKSSMLFYTVKAKNGAITNKAYIEQILEVEVKRWIERGDRFILEQDVASGHGGTGGSEAKFRNPVAK
ncbi:hypothetical protein OEA41_008159 [Lepraria neglecta]|uniref:Uncharacterized protein n=1 Tax=Lepraria neglecta TaxID=209136 RepID=A0AAE0DNS7_9LECA|nr:hypothetical protein OEA41_008159 [Lepraria neglecta]